MTREEAKITLEDLREYKIVLSDIPFNDQEKICDLAISALSAEVRPNIHGQWEKIWRTDAECSEYICSKCGCGEDYSTDFCPNCGADMRESKGEKGAEE